MNPEQVTITIVSTPTEQKEAKIETSYTGLYRKVSNKHVISYEEAFAADDEAPMTSKNIIRFNQNMVHISKKGDVTSQMHFEKDSRHEGIYQTPFGTFATAIDTHDLLVEETASGIRIVLLYTLHMNHAKVSKNEMIISIDHNAES